MKLYESEKIYNNKLRILQKVLKEGGKIDKAFGELRKILPDLEKDSNALLNALENGGEEVNIFLRFGKYLKVLSGKEKRFASYSRKLADIDAEIGNRDRAQLNGLLKRLKDNQCKDGNENDYCRYYDHHKRALKFKDLGHAAAEKRQRTASHLEKGFQGCRVVQHAKLVNREVIEAGKAKHSGTTVPIEKIRAGPERWAVKSLEDLNAKEIIGPKAKRFEKRRDLSSDAKEERKRRKMARKKRAELKSGTFPIEKIRAGPERWADKSLKDLQTLTAKDRKGPKAKRLEKLRNLSLDAKEERERRKRAREERAKKKFTVSTPENLKI